MSNKCIGRCSCCEGNVVVPAVWHGTIPPTPRCEACGATQKNTKPVIEMENPNDGKRTLLNESIPAAPEAPRNIRYNEALGER